MNFPALAASLAAIGTIAGTAITADTRYVKTIDFKQYIGQDYREQLRELEKEIRFTEDEEIKKYLQEEYNELLEEYCAEYEDDRRC